MIDSECSHEHMDSYNYSNMTRGVVILQGTQGTLVKGMMLVYTYLAVPFEFDTSQGTKREALVQIFHAPFKATNLRALAGRNRDRGRREPYAIKGSDGCDVKMLQEIADLYSLVIYT